jgi:hypothetical protein
MVPGQAPERRARPARRGAVRSSRQPGSIQARALLSQFTEALDPGRRRVPQNTIESGVRVFDDHRDNLTVDVDSELVLNHASDMRHEHSESALLWNVFRALQKMNAEYWLPRFLQLALPAARRDGSFPVLGRAQLAAAAFRWWERYDAPPARQAALRAAAQSGCLNLEHYAPRSIPEKRAEIERRVAADLPFEEPVEIPLCVETPEWLLAIDVVYKGNLRRHTPFDARRDAVLRLLDAGSHAAGSAHKQFFPVIVCTDPRTLNLETARLVERYCGHSERLAAALPYRQDTTVLAAAAGNLALLRWRDIGSVLLEMKSEERLGQFDLAVVDELIKYLGRKEIGFNFFRRLK